MAALQAFAVARHLERFAGAEALPDVPEEETPAPTPRPGLHSTRARDQSQEIDHSRHHLNRGRFVSALDLVFARGDDDD